MHLHIRRNSRIRLSLTSSCWKFPSILCAVCILLSPWSLCRCECLLQDGHVGLQCNNDDVPDALILHLYYSKIVLLVWSCCFELGLAGRDQWVCSGGCGHHAARQQVWCIIRESHQERRRREISEGKGRKWASNSFRAVKKKPSCEYMIRHDGENLNRVSHPWQKEFSDH